MNTQKPDNFDSIVRRVNKLLAIAEGNANEHESTAAATQAENIMRKYRIENADIYLEKFKDKAEFGTEDVFESGRLFKWVSYVASSCAMLFGVRAVVNRKYGPKGIVRVITFRGFKEDVEVAKFTFEYLTNTIMVRGEQYRAANAGQGLSGTNSFRQAMSSRIQVRIKEYIASQKQEETSVTGTSLVVAKDAAVSREFGYNKFKQCSGTITNRSAAMQGMDAGDKVDIFRRAVSNDSSNRQVLLSR